jgi:hypothetical protein
MSIRMLVAQERRMVEVVDVVVRACVVRRGRRAWRTEVVVEMGWGI